MPMNWTVSVVDARHWALGAQMGGLELDLITYALLLWNLGGVGVLTSQCWLAPAVLQQGQLVALAALCAYWFMFIPPCTTWLLVLCAVLYHVVTALSPHVPPPPGGSPPPSQMMFEAGPFAYGAHRCDLFCDSHTHRTD